MRILITGGHGFLGKHVSKEFDKLGYTICDGYCNGFQYYKTNSLIWRPSSFDMNLTDQMSVSSGLFGFQPDVILHMAARCGGILANQNSPADFLRDNTQMALNIYECARKNNVKQIYSLGSVCAYPKYCPVPFKEDNIWNGPAEETNFPYGQAKRTLLMLNQTYRQQYGFTGIHFIPVNLYGEYDHFDLINSHVIPALIRKFHDAIVNSLSHVECWGNGTATREFLYAGDAARVITHSVHNVIDYNRPINLGVGQDISIKELAHLIGRLMGYKGDIVFTGDVSDGQPKRMLDVTRAQKVLGWKAQTELEDGLSLTIEWFKTNLGKY
jgi:GDP-L-fucose synthase